MIRGSRAFSLAYWPWDHCRCVVTRVNFVTRCEKGYPGGVLGCSSLGRARCIVFGACCAVLFIIDCSARKLWWIYGLTSPSLVVNEPSHPGPYVLGCRCRVLRTILIVDGSAVRPPDGGRQEGSPVVVYSVHAVGEGSSISIIICTGL